ncbi:cohesin domain-containing protein [Paenibacillus sp. FSL H8-0079]|uniref:cohesin domain-containing protein n=1 Tax=Paenibacillus sp. FSL H8-0079 TaxID=2921375 RepID=UPI0030EE2272
MKSYFSKGRSVIWNRVWAMLLVVSMISSTGGMFVQAADDQAIIEIGTASGAPGETVEVPVTVKETSVDIRDYTTWIEYDADILEVDKIVSNMHNDGDFTPDARVAGSLMARTSLSTLAQTGDKLYTITFRIKSGVPAGTEAILSFQNGEGEFVVSNLSGYDIPTAPISGKVTVTGGNSSGNGPQTPGVVQQVKATGGDGEVILDWGAVTEATYYNVYMGTVSGQLSTTPVASNLTTTQYTVPELTNGTTYYFAIAAGNANGVGTASQEVNATPAKRVVIRIGTVSGAPGDTVEVPITVTSTPENIAAYEIELSFDASALQISDIRKEREGSFFPDFDNAEGWLYTFWLDENGGDTPIRAGDKIFTISFKIKDEAVEKDYPIEDLLLNFTGVSRNFLENRTAIPGKVTVTRDGSSGNNPQIPGVVENVEATSGDEEVTLEWDAVQGAAYYNVYMGTASGQLSTTSLVSNLTTTQYTVPELTNGTTYYFAIAAGNANGVGTASQEVNATPTSPVSPKATIEIDTVSGAPGESVEVPVIVKETNTPIRSFTTWIEYDANVLEIVQIVPNIGSMNDFMINTDEENLIMANSFLSSGPLAQTGDTLYTITFRIKNGVVAGTQTLLNFHSGEGKFLLSNGAGQPISGTPASGKVTIAGDNSTGNGPQVPGVPLDVKATSGDGEVTLEWDEVPGATFYNVYLGTTAGQASTTPIATNLTTTQYTVPELTNGTTYYFTIAAGNVNGLGTASLEVSATPTKPVADKATITIGTVSGAPGDTVKVPVILSVTPENIGAYGMKVDFDASALQITEVKGEAGDTFSSSFDNEAGWVKTGWADSNAGDTPIKAGDKLFEISFKIKTGADVNDYLIQVVDQQDVSSLIFTSVSRESLEKSVTAGKVIVTTGGSSGNDQEVPDTVQNVKATGGAGQVALMWDSVEGATYYNVYAGTASGQVSATPLASNLTATTYTATGLTNGTTYYFVIKAGNDKGLGDASQEISATPTTSNNNDGGSNNGGTGNNNGGTSAGGGSVGTGSSTGSAGTGNTAENDAVIVLVNGKEERAGTMTRGVRDGQQLTTIHIDPQKLEEKLAAEGLGAIVTIPVQVESGIIVGELDGQMVRNMENKQAVLELKTDRATYTIPAGQLQIQSISDQLGQAIALSDIKVQIEIATPTEAMLQTVKDAATTGAFEVVLPPLDFSVKASYGNLTVEVSRFNVYVQRSVVLPSDIDPNKITTGVVVAPDGSVRHVPTKVVKEDETYYAHINSLTNSTYSVVWHPLEFADVADHWSKSAVNDMGSRMVIEGTGNGQFSPDRNITRAEFAAVMVRGLGLAPMQGASSFTDVKSSDWYNQVVNTAYNYKLIDGYEDGSFRPDDKITREQAMVMLSRAMQVVGLTVDPNTSEALRNGYKDAGTVSAWAQQGVAASVGAGIVQGRNDANLAPQHTMTRAEVAVTIQRLLQQAELI